VGDPAAFALALESALDAADVACVLVDVAGLDPASGKRLAQTLAPIAQARGAALVLSGDTRLAGRAGADGAHMSGSGEAFLESVADAVATLKPDHILGVGGLRTRHDAMSAGELDIDYLLFGEPAKDGWVAPFEDRLERVEWWSEIFNVPCVAYAASLAEVAPMARAGADFVALGGAVWDDPRGPASAMRDAAAALRATARPA
jgi:thiamine-phosphate pyrophosphorylase